MSIERFRYEYQTGTLYEYDLEADAYLFVSRSLARTPEKEAIQEYLDFLDREAEEAEEAAALGGWS